MLLLDAPARDRALPTNSVDLPLTGGLDLLGAERALGAWPAARRAGAVRSQGILVLTDLRIAFLDNTGLLTAFPLGKTGCRIPSAPGQLILTTWYGCLRLEFRSPSAACVVADQLWHHVSAPAAHTDLANPPEAVSVQAARQLMPIT